MFKFPWMFGFEGLSVKFRKEKKTHVPHDSNLSQRDLKKTIYIYLDFSFREIVINKYISTIFKDRG